MLRKVVSVTFLLQLTEFKLYTYLPISTIPPAKYQCFTTNSNIIMYIFSANFSCLVMYFRFERQIGHHLIQTFAPSILVVMLSWFSFWIGLDAIPGRVTLLVTSMLTLVTMFTGLKSDIPPVAYVKVRRSSMFSTCIIYEDKTAKHVSTCRL